MSDASARSSHTTLTGAETVSKTGTILLLHDPPTIETECIPPLRPRSREKLPTSLVETRIRRLRQSICEHQQQQTLQHLYSACDHDIRTWERSSVEQIIHQLETGSRASSTSENTLTSLELGQRAPQPLSTASLSSNSEHIQPFTFEVVPVNTTAALRVHTEGPARVIMGGQEPVKDKDLRPTPVDEGQDSTTVHEDETSTLHARRPKQMRRNMFGPSEASISKPESSSIAAEGRIQALERRSIQDLSAHYGSRTHVEADRTEMEEVQDTDTPVSPFETSLYEVDTMEAELTRPAPDTIVKQDVTAENENTSTIHTGPSSSRAEVAPVDVKLLAEALPPEILIHSPSGPSSGRLSPALGTLAMASNSSVAIPMVPQGTPVASPVIAKSIFSNTGPNESIFNPPTVVGDVTKVNGITLTPGGVLGATSDLMPPSTLPVGLDGKLKRRKRLVRRARRMLLRRQILALLLGRELGGITHAQLKQAQAVADLAPLPDTSLPSVL